VKQTRNKLATGLRSLGTCEELSETHMMFQVLETKRLNMIYCRLAGIVKKVRLMYIA
jgi:hypothetical protein